MICSFEVFHAAAIDINETIDRALFELNYRVSIDLSSKLTKFEYLCYKIGGYEWTPPFEAMLRIILRKIVQAMIKILEMTLLHQLEALRRVQLDFLNPLSLSASGLVSPASQGLFSSSIKPSSQNFRGVQFRVVADEILFSNAWACFCNVDAIFHSVHPDRS